VRSRGTGKTRGGVWVFGFGITILPMARANPGAWPFFPPGLFLANRS